MADYSDLYEKAKDVAFRERCEVAVFVLASSIVVDGTATADERKWASTALQGGMGQVAANAVLAANKDADMSVINAASDATLQTHVDNAKAVLVASIQ